jgi:hypothetical protein
MDGLVHAYAWGDAADVLFDEGAFGVGYGPYVGPCLPVVKDYIADIGGAALDGVYNGGSVWYAPYSTEIDLITGLPVPILQGHTIALDGGPLRCLYNPSGIKQTVISGAIIPDLAHTESGSVPGGSIGDYSNFTFVIFLAPDIPYVVQARGFDSGLVDTVQYVVGDLWVESSALHGWVIQVIYDAAGSIYTPNSGSMSLESQSASTFMRSMDFGAFLDGDGWYMLAITSDGTDVKTYSNLGTSDGPVTLRDTEPSTSGPYSSSAPITFGGINVSGGGSGYAHPFNGAWHTSLFWDRPLSLSELNELKITCKNGKKLRTKFFAKRAPAHNDFAHPVSLSSRVTGSCQAVPWDVAGLGTQVGEPTGANVVELHQTGWFNFTPTATGAVTFHTTGLPGDDYSQSPGDATKLYQTLAVYTGTSLGSLTEVDSVDDAQAGLTVTLTAGSTYTLQVGTGKKGSNGVATFAWF